MVHLSEQQQIDGFEITPHAQKAFVHVEWSYLFFTLDPFDLGDNYVAAVLTQTLQFREAADSGDRGQTVLCPHF